MSKVRRLQFMGSWGWLIFWMIVFFPYGLLVLLFNTIVIEEDIDADRLLAWHQSRKKTR